MTQFLKVFLYCTKLHIFYMRFMRPQAELMTLRNQSPGSIVMKIIFEIF